MSRDRHVNGLQLYSSDSDHLSLADPSTLLVPQTSPDEMTAPLSQVGAQRNEPFGADYAAFAATAFDTGEFGQAFEPPVYNGAGTGASDVAASGNARIDGILIGKKWSSAITYSFPDAAGDYQAGYSYDGDGDGASVQNEGFSQFSAAQMLVTHFALNAATYTQPASAAGFSVEGFTGLGITALGGGSGAGTIRAANSSDPGTSYAFYPNSDNYGGDTWIGPSARSPTPGNYDWHTHLHELGHALGLKHGQETGGPANTALPTNYDSMEYSVMTYRSYVGHDLVAYPYYTNETWGYAQTYMMLDIAALQYMYGADYGVNSGDTTYSWDPSTGQTFVNGAAAITPGGNRVFLTIWDGGGNDTYNLSNYTTNLSIDLQPGQESRLSSAQLAYLGNSEYASGNVYNALLYQGNTASLIENATGGSGNDGITGNTADNVLQGNDGNDTLSGLSGIDTLKGGGGDDFLSGDAGDDVLLGLNDNDTLKGGGGADYLDGGAGFDMASYFLSSTAVIVSLADGSASGGEAAGDTLAGFEGIIGSGYNDILTGDAAGNRLEGMGGHDALTGAEGNDTLFGGLGNDTLKGGGGADSLAGSDGSDVLLADVGSDTLVGGAGADNLDGGADTDTADYSTSPGGVTVDLAAGTGAGGDAAGDTLSGIENVVGSNFNDSITGDSLANRLTGGIGSDTLVGADGGDTLLGGSENDSLYGQLADDNLKGGIGQDRLYGGEGNDTLLGQGDGDTLSGAGGEDVLRGGGGDDSLIGSNDDDRLFGETNNDTLSGGGGDDQLRGGGGNDSMNGGSGNDRLLGDSGNDTLIGSTGDDTLTGGTGNDRLVGGGGFDVLTGSGGGDTFDFNAITESLPGATRDRITDFAQGQDLIDLSTIDAIAGGGDDAFTFIGEQAFSDNSAGQLRQFTSGASIIIEAEVNDDGVADFQVRIAIAGLVLAAGDFVL